jgi:hypothetical protein
LHAKLGEKFVTDWNKNELYLNKAKVAIASIKDLTIRAKVTSLQRAIFDHVTNGDTAKADAVFKELNSLAKAQTERLCKVTATVLLNYRFRDNGEFPSPGLAIPAQPVFPPNLIHSHPTPQHTHTTHRPPLQRNREDTRDPIGEANHC